MPAAKNSGGVTQLTAHSVFPSFQALLQLLPTFGVAFNIGQQIIAAPGSFVQMRGLNISTVNSVFIADSAANALGALTRYQLIWFEGFLRLKLTDTTLIWATPSLTGALGITMIVEQ